MSVYVNMFVRVFLHYIIHTKNKQKNHLLFKVSYHTDWITDLRSTVTLKKNLDQLVIYVGYMGHILDDTLVNNRYEELTISTNSSDFISNWKQLAVLYEERKNFMELELDLNTPLANAFYYPDVDKVFIPAGIVQMPEFHPDFPDVLKFAKLGATIGHELGHALHFYVNGVTSECELRKNNCSFKKNQRLKSLKSANRLDNLSNFVVSIFERITTYN